MPETPAFMRFLPVLRRHPDAVAVVSGSRDHPRLRGSVRFCQTDRGVLVLAEISGLPAGNAGAKIACGEIRRFGCRG